MLKHPGNLLQSWQQTLDILEIKLKQLIDSKIASCKIAIIQSKQNLKEQSPLNKIENKKEVLRSIQDKLHYSIIEQQKVTALNGKIYSLNLVH